jgi:hypothetical protein
MDHAGEAVAAAQGFVAPQGGGLTDAQAARQRAAARQAAKRGQQAGVPRAFALPAASAGDSEGSAGSSGSDEEQEEEDSPRKLGKRPAAGGKANAEAERERKRCVWLPAVWLRRGAWCSATRSLTLRPGPQDAPPAAQPRVCAACSRAQEAARRDGGGEGG